MKTCLNCNKEIHPYHNHCSWECNIELAKKSGGTVNTPNGLPIKCIKYDNSMLEHEHGDHPDYKFPVDVYYVGNNKEKFGIVGEDCDEELIESQCRQTHAFIYTDGNVILTLYECQYKMWLLHDGLEDIQNPEWRLTKESIDKINELYSGSIRT